MYVIFEYGGKQYRGRKNQVLCLEKTSYGIGQNVVFDKILMISGSSPTFGNPFVYGAKMTAKVLNHGKKKKIIVIKLHRRKHFRKRQGHRQCCTYIKIIDFLYPQELKNGA